MEVKAAFAGVYSTQRLGDVWRQIADEITDARPFQRLERQRPAEIHRSDADARRHHAVDDAFTGGRARKFRGQNHWPINCCAMLSPTAMEPANGEMREHIAHQADHAERAGSAAVELRHGADQLGRFVEHIENVHQRTQANGGDNGYSFGRAENQCAGAAVERTEQFAFGKVDQLRRVNDIVLGRFQRGAAFCRFRIGLQKRA